MFKKIDKIEGQKISSFSKKGLKSTFQPLNAVKLIFHKYEAVNVDIFKDILIRLTLVLTQVVLIIFC